MGWTGWAPAPEGQALGGQTPGVPLVGESVRSTLLVVGGCTEAHLIETQFLVIRATGNVVGARLQVCPALVRAASAHVAV